MKNSKSAPSIRIPKIITPPPDDNSTNFSFHSKFYLDTPSVANDSSLELFADNSTLAQISRDDEAEDHSSLHSNLMPNGNRHYEKRGSSRASAISELIKQSDLIRRTSHVMLDIPVENVKKIAQTKSVNSMDRETKHFANTTTMHGPKRMYFAKGWGVMFWICMTAIAFILLMIQIGSLVNIYLSRPIVSQVSFIINEQGMPFPDVTLCNFNPIRKSYVSTLNKTGDFSIDLLRYLMLYDMDAAMLYGTGNRQELQTGQNSLDNYIKLHPNFTVDGFYMDAGFGCEDVFKLCSIGGRIFECCKHVEHIRTSFGKCHTLKLLDSASEWMHRQTEPGINSGIQIIVDAHLEEQFGNSATAEGDTEPLFANGYENGYRYFVHARETLPYLSGAGISISPNTVAYTSISTNEYVLLPRQSWGNCSDKYPEEIAHTNLSYSTINCQSLCKAKYFMKNCNCTPAVYNIDQSYPECSPFITYVCIDEHLRTLNTNNESRPYYASPDCSECKIDCFSTTYQTYNSYGQGLSNGALYWLSKKNPTWTIAHMKQNFGIVNIYFSAMTYTKYSQVQAMSLTEILSDIGGNMGMFLGVSILTIAELLMFFSKIIWIFVSKKRREYMYRKKAGEMEQEKKIEEVVTGFQLFRTRKRGDTGTGSLSNLKDMVAHQNIQTVSPTELDIAKLAWQENSDKNEPIVEIPKDEEAHRKTTAAINEEALVRLRQMHGMLEDHRRTKLTATIADSEESSNTEEDST